MKKVKYGIYEFNHKEILITSIDSNGNDTILFHSYRVPSHKTTEALLKVLAKGNKVKYERMPQNIDSYFESIQNFNWS